jgi:hypothetical protein
VGEQRCEPAGVDDAGFVQDDDPARIQAAGLPSDRVALVGIGKQPRE